MKIGTKKGIAGQKAKWGWISRTQGKGEKGQKAWCERKKSREEHMDRDGITVKGSQGLGSREYLTRKQHNLKKI